jgi:hypothetical protein
MTLEILDPRHDAFNDEMRFPYPLTGQANSEVRIPRKAIVQGEAWVKARIEGWFIDHERPQPGTWLRIPDHQFDPKLFQPSR